VKWQTLGNGEFASSSISTLKQKTASETYEMLQKTFCDEAQVEHKPLNGIHVSKLVTLWLGILNVQVIHCQVRLMTM
jgi:hypothetical protein